MLGRSFLELNTWCTSCLLYYIQIHLVSRHSEWKAAFRIKTIMRHLHIFTFSPRKYLWVVSCLTSAVLQWQYEKEERMSVWSPAHQTNAIKYALRSAIQNARWCARHICLCWQWNSRGGTHEENHRRLGLLDCWIAGRWTTSDIFACRCQKRPQRIFDHIKRTFPKRQ